VDDVRQASEDTLFDLLEHLPQEAQEALLKLAVGERPEPAETPSTETDPFAHPDAQRRFRILTNVEELERALEYPWEKWAVFLHPEQRRFVERTYNGSARISGSAGTGKTIVALHRAVHLARDHPDERVLLTTFSNALANALTAKLRHLVGNEPAVGERITVRSMRGIGYELYSAEFGPPNIAPSSLVRSLLSGAAEQVEGHNFSPAFLLTEWSEVVDAWQIHGWEAYRDVSRLGRKTRIGGKQRELLWSIFEQVREVLAARKAVTWADVFGRVTESLAAAAERPFAFAVVDEAQDLGVAEARFLAALGSGRADALFLAGDLGQRIFQQPFSWKSLGIDVRGRSHTLRINYRTSHQIRARADRLLPAALADVDGVEESRRGTISVFEGTPPDILGFDTPTEESETVGRWIANRLREGYQPHEIGVFVRSEAQLKRARAAIKSAGIDWLELTEKLETASGKATIGSMHLAKGLEFRAVAVMACDDEIIPSQERIETVTDISDLEEVYNTERHLLYVACTRARDRLLVSGVDPVSEFVEDLSA